MYRLTKIYIFIYILTFFFSNRNNIHYICMRWTCVHFQTFGNDASEWWLNVSWWKNKRAYERKEVKGQLGNFVLGNAMEPKHCCHCNKSSCSFYEAVSSDWLNLSIASWELMMRDISKEMKQSGELRMPMCFSPFLEEPWPTEQRPARKCRPQKAPQVRPTSHGVWLHNACKTVPFSREWQTTFKKTKQKKTCSYTSNSQTFVPHE